MLLDREKLEKVMISSGLNLAGLAKECGISRRSIYDMFEGRSIFSVPFEKLLKKLGVSALAVTNTQTTISEIFADAPPAILKVALRLEEFAKTNSADLFLFGSRARGKKGIRADWDFAFSFSSDEAPESFASFKQEMLDRAFPYRIDIVLLNNAPEWFLSSVRENAVRIAGVTPLKKIFGRGQKIRRGEDNDA